MVLISARFMSVARSVTFLLFAGFFLSACAAHSGFNSGQLPVDGRPVAVLVLPFSNLTTTPDAGKSITTLLTAELLRKSAFVVVPADSVPFTIPSGVSAINIPANLRDHLKSMGIKAVLSGTVIEYAYRSELESEPVAGVNWVMTDLRSGHVIWSVALSGVGSCFMGCRQTLTALSGTLIEREVDRFVGR